ncbi:hypothetical protein TRIUR3_33432 [Triticum urartu]|uniref:Trichome birefringence-like C-terminal domain-containing protein n=1 Tax=Triticum urartu TaxID=4572 RepID=M7YID7_TRIUA|nr:hypothetical protein TRIUR3_33432 [Triticum urartu]
MGASTPRHHSSSWRQKLPRLTKKILTLSLYALVPLAVLHYLLSPPPVAVPSSTSTSPPHDGNKQQGAAGAASRKQGSTAPAPRCDYSEGQWVRDAAGPRYSGTSCGATIKDGQNCMANGRPDTGLYLAQPDERWAAELPGIDVVVLSIGHWFMHPAMYYEQGAVIGCHHCPEPNRTGTGFFGVFRLAVKNALREVIARARASPGQEKLAVVATFSPAHFDGEWDSPDACARTEPYAPGEKEMLYMDREMCMNASLLAGAGVVLCLVGGEGASALRGRQGGETAPNADRGEVLALAFSIPLNHGSPEKKGIAIQ